MGSSPKNRTSPGRETRGVEAQSSVRKPSVPCPDEDRMQNEYKRARLESQERGMPPREREEPGQQQDTTPQPQQEQSRPEMFNRERARQAVGRSQKRREERPEMQRGDFGFNK
jgi:hypothetical protein